VPVTIAMGSVPVTIARGQCAGNYSEGQGVMFPITIESFLYSR